MNLDEVNNRAKGKLVILGYSLDRIAGVFSTVDTALDALQASHDQDEGGWWLEFRSLDAFRDTCIFDRVLLRTKHVEGGDGLVLRKGAEG